MNIWRTTMTCQQKTKLCLLWSRKRNALQWETSKSISLRGTNNLWISKTKPICIRIDQFYQSMIALWSIWTNWTWKTALSVIKMNKCLSISNQYIWFKVPISKVRRKINVRMPFLFQREHSGYRMASVAGPNMDLVQISSHSISCFTAKKLLSRI